MRVVRPVTVIDHVLRKEAYERNHPGVLIEHHTEPLWHWSASWADADGCARYVTDYNLGPLIDELEALADAGNGPSFREGSAAG